MDFLVVQFLNGLASASALFLVASGLSIIFGVTRVVNFAHGSFYMLGAYIAYTLVERIGSVEVRRGRSHPGSRMRADQGNLSTGRHRSGPSGRRMCRSRRIGVTTCWGGRRKSDSVEPAKLARSNGSAVPETGRDRRLLWHALRRPARTEHRIATA